MPSLIAPFNLLIIVGATASGKTSLAVALAKQLNGEIISADSRQVYRGMDIGSGKDLSEYDDVPYHLIDIVDPGFEYSVYHFQRDFFTAFEEITQRGRTPILVGGTGLYIDAVVKGYRLVPVPENPTLRAVLSTLSLEELQQQLLILKPQQHNTTDMIERERLYRAIEIVEGERLVQDDSAPLPTIKPLYLGLHWERPQLRQRITQRLNERLQNGMIEEVQHLHQQGVSYEVLEFMGLEYRFIAQHLQGTLNYNDMKQKLNAAIHQYAKRQDTWFRKLQRRGTTIHWLTGKSNPAKEALNLMRHKLGFTLSEPRDYE